MVVVGSANADLVVRVPVLPGPGETVSGGSFSRSPGGKGANQAAAAARLGAPTWFVGIVGDDEFGREARADLASLGVDVSHLRVGTSPTGVAEVLVDTAGENMIAVAPGANAELDGRAVEAALGSVPAEGGVVLANLEIGDEAVEAAAEMAIRRGFLFVLNPAPPRALGEQLLSACAVVTPNEHEAARLGAPSIQGLLDLGARAVVVTRGSEGADLHVAGKPAAHQPAFPVEVADTTGAGDCFNGALAWALAGGRELVDAVRLASAAAALSTRALGARAGLPSAGEVERLAGHHSGK